MVPPVLAAKPAAEVAAITAGAATATVVSR